MIKSIKHIAILLIFSLFSTIVIAKNKEVKQMELISTAFSNNQIIPKKYTCDGDDVSPPLAWDNVPKASKSLVLIFDDPDAPRGTWDHWILFNIPSQVNALPENIAELPNGTLEGLNSWGNAGYGGPCPPSGIHRYIFKLYALDVLLNLPEKATKPVILKAMDGHVIALAELIGKYERS